MERLIPRAEIVGERLLARGETIGISESSSGGLISAALLAVPGASRFYRGAGVIYTPNAFRGLMGLSKDDLAGMRSATEPYARLMATTIKDRLRTNWGLCETGAAGPSGNGYGDEAGHVCAAIVGGTSEAPIERSLTRETDLSDRIENMYVFAETALDLLRGALD
ncbi:MAG: CinA family protein [Pseudomonadota bacterium]